MVSGDREVLAGASEVITTASVVDEEEELTSAGADELLKVELDAGEESLVDG